MDKFLEIFQKSLEEELNLVGDEIIEKTMEEMREKLERKKAEAAAVVAKQIKIQLSQNMPGMEGLLKCDIHID